MTTGRINQVANFFEHSNTRSANLIPITQKRMAGNEMSILEWFEYQIVTFYQRRFSSGNLSLWEHCCQCELLLPTGLFDLT